MPAENGNGADPKNLYGTLLAAAKQFGIHAVVAACLTGLVCWFLWQKELYSQKKDEFIQQSLMAALTENGAINRQLTSELATHATHRHECKSAIEGNTAALKENSLVLEETQKVLSATQEVLKERK